MQFSDEIGDKLGAELEERMRLRTYEDARLRLDDPPRRRGSLHRRVTKGCSRQRPAQGAAPGDLVGLLQPGVPQLGKVTLVLPFGAFVDLGVGVFGVLPASEFASPEEDREQIKARNEPGATGPVVRGRGVRVEVVSVDLEKERALLRLS